MLHGWRVWPVLLGLSGSVVLPVLSAGAETLYRWRGDGGEAAYSNLSPPSGVEEFSAVAGVSSGNDDAIADRMAQSLPQTGLVSAGANPGATSSPEQTADFLRARISKREASVRRIETLLKSQPNDPSLRRHLREKRKTIGEDRIRLELLPN